jgi:hypothetical protein
MSWATTRKPSAQNASYCAWLMRYRALLGVIAVTISSKVRHGDSI